MTVQTSVFIRNYVAAGDYFVYGWTVIDGSERKHLVRIMKLNENYSRFSQDVTVEIDCPPGHSGKLRVRSCRTSFSGSTKALMWLLFR